MFSLENFVSAKEKRQKEERHAIMNVVKSEINKLIFCIPRHVMQIISFLYAQVKQHGSL